MSTNLNYKQVANVERRTWDLEAYEQRAKERAKNESSTGNKKKKRKHDKSSASLPTLGPRGGDDDPGQQQHQEEEEQKEEFQRAAKGAAGPVKSERAFLKARRNRVDVDSKIGSVEIINPDAVSTTKAHVGEPGSVKDGITKTGVGWHCKVCDCFLRDSHTYLDHINGRKHQRNLGYSMRVERSTKDQVASRLALLAKEKEKQKQMTDEVDEDFQSIVMAKDKEAQRRKEERAKQRKERRKMTKAIGDPSEEKEDEQNQVDDPTSNNTSVVKDNSEGHEEEEEIEQEDEEEESNPDIAALMGFSGFGGGNKNR